MIRHPDCGAVWTGRAAAHCTACCVTFGSTSAFDLHRRATGDHGRCVSPLDAGLVLSGAMWRQPGLDDVDRAALRNAA